MGCETSRPVAPHAEAEAESKRILEALLATVVTATAPGGCFRIEDTAKRAITLDQLESVVKHTAKRFGCEMEAGHEIKRHKDKRDLEANAQRRASAGSASGRKTARRRARGGGGEVQRGEPVRPRQVRHPAGNRGEAVRDGRADGERRAAARLFREPLLGGADPRVLQVPPRARVGARVRGGGRVPQWAVGFDGDKPHPLYLGSRPPRYWVCAYANNQWTLASELVEDLAETSFARAMRISMGTVSVVDRSAGCFGRIWCVYELSYSVRREDKKEFMYDIVTAKEWDHYGNTHGAVAITDGLSAQQNDAVIKLDQEQAFPLELIDKGIAFKCKDGKASFEEDKVRILKAIGDGSETLDAKVHGVVACAALRRALEEGGTRRATFLEAVRNGHVRKLQLNL